ncbi:MAG: KH domain-containing protein, partial [Candidatus Eremiobacteraeota bacterium]|nr:KH domain-containing protein [Candidatus Eremiobacteraeota bacterium]
VDIKQVISEVLGLMNMKAEIEEDKDTEENQDKFNIYGDDLGALIGKHGQTLEAFQFVINLIVNKHRLNKRKVVIDVEGYRARREKGLRDLAIRSAQKAKRERKNVVLEPMNASERRIIHLALKNDSEIVTYSNGQEPLRRVVISSRRGAHDNNRRKPRRRTGTAPRRREPEAEAEHQEEIVAPVQYDDDVELVSSVKMKEIPEKIFEDEKEAKEKEIAAPVQFDDPENDSR